MKRKILSINTAFLIDISKLETMFSHDDTSYVRAMQPVVKSRKKVAPLTYVGFRRAQPWPKVFISVFERLCY